MVNVPFDFLYSFKYSMASNRFSSLVSSLRSRLAGTKSPNQAIQATSGDQSLPWTNPSTRLVNTAIDYWNNKKLRRHNCTAVTALLDPPDPPVASTIATDDADNSIVLLVPLKQEKQEAIKFKFDISSR